MPAVTLEPELDAVLGLGDGCSYGALRGRAVGIGGRTRDIALTVETFQKLVIGAADMLAENVAARGFVLAEIAGRAGGSGRLGARPSIGGNAATVGLACNQTN